MTVIDPIVILRYTFLGGALPRCLEAADVDDDATINGVLDAVYGLTYSFLGGPGPAAPFPECGLDPETLTTHGCISFPPCL